MHSKSGIEKIMTNDKAVKLLKNFSNHFLMDIKIIWKN